MLITKLVFTAHDCIFRVKKISVVRNPTSKDYTVELEHYTFSDVAEWLKQQYLELPVIEELALDFVREEGRLIKIGDVIIPENHIVEYGFLEGKKFWYRDIFGGDIYFLIHVYAENMSEEEVDKLMEESEEAMNEMTPESLGSIFSGLF